MIIWTCAGCQTPPGQGGSARVFCGAKKRGREGRASIPTIGGGWRNDLWRSAGGDPDRRVDLILAYCSAACKTSSLPYPGGVSLTPQADPVAAHPVGDHVKARVKWVEGASFVAETGSGHAVVVDGALAAGTSVRARWSSCLQGRRPAPPSTSYGFSGRRGSR